MADKEVKQQLEELRRRAASNDVTGFAAMLCPLLTENFDKWFRIAKEQKLIGQFRSLVYTREFRRLFSVEFRSVLSTRDAEAFGQHLAVCEFMQDLFSHIDNEALALQCCAAHPENVARVAVQLIEVAHCTFQRSVPDPASLPMTIRMSQLAEFEARFRSILDAGNTILNSTAAKKGFDRNHVVSNSDLNELLRLAQLYAEMLQVLDLYTYAGAEIEIKRRSLVVKRSGRESDLAAVVGAERSGDHDHVRLSILAPLEVSVHKECDLVPLDTSDTFLDFLRKIASGEAGTATRQFGQAYKRDLGIEIREFFDLETQVITKAGTFTVEELTRAWALLYTIAMLGQRWNERLAEYRFRGDPQTARESHIAPTLDVAVPELGRNWLVRILSREAGLPRRVSRSLIDQFTSRPAVGRIDLFYKPLLCLSNDVVLLPTPYIRGSRFERNLFTLIATETDLDQKKKGYLPVSDLQLRFQNAEFQALTNFRVKVNHDELTDIDLVAFKEDILFLGQCKIVIEPDSVYDSWKVESKLNFAAAQLDTCMAHLDEVRPALFNRLGLRGRREQRVVPFIVTNTRQFTETQFRGHPVVDIPYLRFLLGGAREGVIKMNARRIGLGSGRSFIRGTYPSGEELADLVKHTVHRVQEREVHYSYVMRSIGNLKVHVPIMSVRSAGQSRFVVTEEESLEEDEPLF